MDSAAASCDALIETTVSFARREWPSFLPVDRQNDSGS
jgi:hypothetical protein